MYLSPYIEAEGEETLGGSSGGEKTSPTSSQTLVSTDVLVNARECTILQNTT